MGVGLWPETDEALVPDASFDASGEVRPHVEYQTDPIGWAVDKLGIPEHTLRWSLNPGYDAHKWDGDPDPLAMAAEALRDWKDAGIESATTTGKTFLAAVLTLWFLACHEDARVFTFAPKEDQLKLFIWMEIGKLWPQFHAMFPGASLTDLRLQMIAGSDAWAAQGYAVGVGADEQSATKAQGMHAEHMLLIYEETPGIHSAVLQAGENTSTAPHNLRLALGNPNHKLDSLHRFCTSPGVVHIRISAYDHPNVVSGNPSLIPGAVSQASIDRRLAKYSATSPVFQSRVRGLSPDQASDALIRLEWLEAANRRYQARKELEQIPTIVTGKGVDVANSEHGDRACIVDFAKNVVVRVEAFQCPDANQLGRQVKLEMQAAGLFRNRVGVDAIGVGAGTVNELRRLGSVVQALNAGGSPMKMVEKAPDGKEVEWSGDVNVFKNLRSQMWWQLREDLRLGTIDMEKDDELWEELTEPTFVDDPKTIIEPKDEIRERLGRSPDKADALVMANWVRERAVIRPEREAAFDKTPHRARSWVVDDQGHAIPHPKAPKSIDELADRLAPKSANKTPFRRLVPSNRQPR